MENIFKTIRLYCNQNRTFSKNDSLTEFTSSELNKIELNKKLSSLEKPLLEFTTYLNSNLKYFKERNLEYLQKKETFFTILEEIERIFTIYKIEDKEFKYFYIILVSDYRYIPVFSNNFFYKISITFDSNPYLDYFQLSSLKKEILNKSKIHINILNELFSFNKLFANNFQAFLKREINNLNKLNDIHSLIFNNKFDLKIFKRSLPEQINNEILKSLLNQIKTISNSENKETALISSFIVLDTLLSKYPSKINKNSRNIKSILNLINSNSKELNSGIFENKIFPFLSANDLFKTIHSFYVFGNPNKVKKDDFKLLYFLADYFKADEKDIKLIDALLSHQLENNINSDYSNSFSFSFKSLSSICKKQYFNFYKLHLTDY